MTALITLTIITIAIIVICIWSYFDDRDTLFGISIAIIAILAMFGWGVYGSTATQYKKEKEAKILEVLKGKHVALVTTSTPVGESTSDYDESVIFDKYNIDLINDTTKFYWEESYNLYGVMIKAKLSIK